MAYSGGWQGGQGLSQYAAAYAQQQQQMPTAPPAPFPAPYNQNPAAYNYPMYGGPQAQGYYGPPGYDPYNYGQYDYNSMNYGPQYNMWGQGPSTAMMSQTQAGQAQGQAGQHTVASTEAVAQAQVQPATQTQPPKASTDAGHAKKTRLFARKTRYNSSTLDIVKTAFAASNATPSGGRQSGNTEAVYPGGYAAMYSNGADRDAGAEVETETENEAAHQSMNGIYCDVCDATYINMQKYRNHLKGMLHITRSALISNKPHAMSDTHSELGQSETQLTTTQSRLQAMAQGQGQSQGQGQGQSQGQSQVQGQGQSPSKMTQNKSPAKSVVSPSNSKISGQSAVVAINEGTPNKSRTWTQGWLNQSASTTAANVTTSSQANTPSKALASTPALSSRSPAVSGPVGGPGPGTGVITSPVSNAGTGTPHSQSSHSSLNKSLTNQKTPAAASTSVPASTEEPMEESDDEGKENYCTVCHMQLENRLKFNNHTKSMIHIQKQMMSVTGNKKERKVEAGQPQPQDDKDDSINIEEDPSDWTYCDVCEASFKTQQSFLMHTRGMVHISKALEKENPENSQLQAAGTWRAPPKIPIKSIQRNVVKTTHWEDMTVRDLNPWDMDVINNWDSKRHKGDFWCEVCSIDCTSLDCYEKHLIGKKHAKQLKKLGMVPGETVSLSEVYSMSKEDIRRKLKKPQVLIQESLDNFDSEPLIGLNYMIEYRPDTVDDEILYFCEMCDAKININQVISHACGLKHRNRYMKWHYPVFHAQLLKISEKSKKTESAKIFAKEVEIGEGRGRLQIKSQELQRSIEKMLWDNDDNEDEDAPKLASIFNHMKGKSFGDYDAMSGETADPYSYNYSHGGGGGGAYIAGQGYSAAQQPPVKKTKGQPDPQEPQLSQWQLTEADVAMLQPMAADTVAATMAHPSYMPPEPRQKRMPQAQKASPHKSKVGKTSATNVFTASMSDSKKAANSVKESIAAMLGQVGQCQVMDESEADAALQVSNVLTQALLQFRIKQANVTAKSKAKKKKKQKHSALSVGGGSSVPPQITTAIPTTNLTQTPAASVVHPKKQRPSLQDSFVKKSTLYTVPNPSAGYSRERHPQSGVNVEATNSSQQLYWGQAQAQAQAQGHGWGQAQEHSQGHGQQGLGQQLEQQQRGEANSAHMPMFSSMSFQGQNLGIPQRKSKWDQRY